LAAGDDVCALANWGLVCLLLQRLAPEMALGDWHAELARLAQRQSDRSTARQQTEPGFYEAAGLADLLLVQLLLAADDERAVQRLAGQAAAGYRSALARGASLRDSAAVRENLDFLSDMVDASAGAARPWPAHVHSASVDLRCQF
ncbi:MAG: hypothetical protein M3Y32_06565, partial [Pseudomonadota bacterium]|nr:hypothetical protein [Pseudomonadota bacterium]